MRTSSVLLALAAALPSASAWWCNGHMLVANIAFKSVSPATVQAVTPLISYLASDYPTSPDFTQAACWADDLKTLGVEQYNSWHFIDLPVLRGPAFFDIPAVGNSSNNPWAISESTNTLTSPDATTLDKALQLRLLIHILGDLHQPLHAATLFSQQFPPPTGDMGGNLYNITGVDETELHAFWDGGAEQWTGDLSRPLNTSGWAWMESWTTSIMASFPSSGFGPELAMKDPFDWAAESNTLASTFAYTAPQAPTPISGDYITAAQTMCQSRVALGGYRLAALLDSIFGNSAEGVKKVAHPRMRGSKSRVSRS